MQEIADWLDKLGMSEYAQRFAENRIDFSVLPDLTDQDLEKMGVVLGDRRKILRAIATLSDAGEVNQRTTAPAEATSAVRPRDFAERRQVTVMFSDLVGSTALSSRMDPEDLREVISAYQKCVAETVQCFGGFVAKYMGDGVLIYFGYPQAHEDDAERAVRAGLELIQALGALKSSAPLQTRVGIATGLVVVGDLIGSGEAQERGIVGETPNLAARLQGVAEPNTVVIGANTRRLLGNLFELQDLGVKEVKGIAEPVHAWAALRASAVESRFEALRTATTPLVGRDEEVALLMRRWEQAKVGDGSVVLISGEPGIGKSRLAETIVDRLAADPHIRLRYLCSPYHQDSALHPAIGQLERAAGFQREDTAEKRLDKLEALLSKGTNDLREAAPLVADLLSIPTGDRYPALELTPQKHKEKTLAALVTQVEGLSRREPVLMLYEDVHWSDPTTRELLDLLIERVPALRVLLIITFRPEFAPPWIGRPDLTLLSLSRLPPRQRAEMIAHLTGGKALPKEISDQIVERTDGVPLFVEELTKAVVESGILTETGDRYTVSGPIAPLAIPTSLHGSLLARLDRLAPTREVAQIGAALGRQFSHELISAVAATPQQSVDDALAQLVSAELIFRRGIPPDAEYTFKHALIRDAAYDTLLRSSRQQLHARIAAVLEKRFPETAATTPEVLAQHYTAAGIVSQAIPYWLKAGRAALQRSALIEAISHLTRGLELVQSIPDESNRAELELELQATLALTLTAARGYAAAEVEQTYARARTLCDQLSNSPQLFPVLYGLFIFHWCRGHLQTAQDGASEMLEIALRAGDPELQLIGHGALGEITWHIGDNKTALDHLNEAYSRYDENVHASHASVYGLDFGVMVLSYLDSAQLVLGYPDRSSQAGNEAVALARRLKHPVILCSALGFGVTNMLYRRDPSAIVKLADECIALAGELGFPHWIGMATAYRGWAVAQLGAAEDGINQVRQGISTWRATGADVALGCYFAALSESQLVGHNAEAALASADEAIAWVERNGEGQWKTLAHCCRGDALLALNSPDQARSEYELALSAARQQGAKWWELRAAIHLAGMRRRDGKLEDARKILEPIYSWFNSGFDLRDLKEAKALLDELR